MQYANQAHGKKKVKDEELELGLVGSIWILVFEVRTVSLLLRLMVSTHDTDPSL